MKKLNLSVKGMTCSSCEILIERGLKKVPGVEKVKVSRAKERAEVECSDSVQLQQLQDAVKEKGYVLSLEESPTNNNNNNNNNSNNSNGNLTNNSSNNHYANNSKRSPLSSFILKDRERYSEIGAVLVVLFGVYFLLTQFDVLPKNFGVTDNMSYGLIFVIGLVAATSTCLAVAGGLLLAVSSKFDEKNKHLKGWQKFKPHIYFNAGRIASYALLGGVVGALGSMLTLSPGITGIITIIASLLMIIMGLQLLGVFPWLNRIQIKMPKFIAHKIYDASSQKAGKASLFLFGATTFFLPCGFTQALQLYVLGKGSFAVGSLTMLAFSLGTLPALISLGAFSSFAKGNLKHYFMTFSAVLVIVLGIFNLTPGYNLVGAAVAVSADDNGVGGDGNAAVAAAAADSIAADNGIGGDINGDIGGKNDNPNIVGEKQIIEMKVNGFDYYPNKFTLKKGVPVEWRIDGRNAQGCARVISVPQLGITEMLSSNEVKIVEFTPQKNGSIKFSCSMGMAGPGTFEII